MPAAATRMPRAAARLRGHGGAAMLVRLRRIGHRDRRPSRPASSATLARASRLRHPEPNRRRIAAARPTFTAQDRAEILPVIDAILESGWLILGEHTRRFEERFAHYVGTEHAVAVSTCSAALQIVMRHLAVRGREVILPTNNFPGVVSALHYEGGLPVLAEMDADTFCLDVDDALSRVTPRTAGIVITHIAGLVHPQMDRLRDACRERGIFLVEDASHAHGAALDDRKAGSLADAACFSFYPTKIMTTATGGMITTDDADLADHARLLRHHGQGQSREQFLETASDWCMSEIHAAIGLQQLSHLDEYVDHRNQVAGWYRAALAGCDWVEVPAYTQRVRHAYYKLPTRLDPSVDRDRLRERLEREFGIENGTVYDPPCHLQPALQDVLGLGPGAFPVAEAALRQQFCPPMHAGITADDVRAVVEIAGSIVDRCRRPAGS